MPPIIDRSIGGISGPAGSGFDATTASVVKSKAEIDAAFCKAYNQSPFCFCIFHFLV